MSQFNSLQLLNTLKADHLLVTKAVEQLLPRLELINIAPAPGKWSIAQVLEHLNFYHKYYIPAIENAFRQYPPSVNTPVSTFSTGLMGGYLTKMMQPDADGKVSNKTRAFKNFIPEPHLDAQKVIGDFLKSQELFTEILHKAQFYNLNKVRISMSFSKLIRLKLGDLLRVLVIHQQRHLIQINEALKMVKSRELQHN